MLKSEHLAKHKAHIVEAAQAFAADLSNLEARTAYVRATFNLDTTAQVIASLADAEAALAAAKGALERISRAEVEEFEEDGTQVVVTMSGEEAADIASHALSDIASRGGDSEGEAA